jgi:hypothetical protein
MNYPDYTNMFADRGPRFLQKHAKHISMGSQKKMGIRYVVLLDEPENSIAKRFKVEFIPNKFIIDKTGTIILGPEMQLTFDKIEKSLSVLQ